MIKPNENKTFGQQKDPEKSKNPDLINRVYRKNKDIKSRLDRVKKEKYMHSLYIAALDAKEQYLASSDRANKLRTSVNI